MTNKIENIMKKLILVQNINNAGMLKVQGEDINFARPQDEFARYLIAEIPNFYWAIKKLTTMGKIDKDYQNDLVEDARAYLEHFESLAEVFLEESNCKTLGD